MRERDLNQMLRLIPDSLMHEVAVSEADGDIAELIGARYTDQLVQRVTLYDIGNQDESELRTFVTRLRG
jgi:hypothetical protein